MAKGNRGSMIWKVSLYIFLLIMVLLIPLQWVHYSTQKDTMLNLFNLHGAPAVIEQLKKYQTLLKHVSQIEPSQTQNLKKEFSQANQIKQGITDLQAIREVLLHDFLKQSVLRSALVLAISLVFSFLLALSLIKMFSGLEKQNFVNQKKVEKLHQIEDWQRVVRILVHEMKAPLTPLKLLASSLTEKYTHLETKQFAHYLQQAQELMTKQISVLETMIQSFVQFSKLPKAVLKPENISEVLQQFTEQYAQIQDRAVTYQLNLPDHFPSTWPLDRQLLHQLFFNLVKNSAEANPQIHLVINIKAISSAEFIEIEISDNGSGIPVEIKRKIFEPHFSTKMDHSLQNLGLGLTIAHKIALEHHGELRLKNHDQQDAIFVLQMTVLNKSRSNIT